MNSLPPPSTSHLGALPTPVLFLFFSKKNKFKVSFPWGLHTYVGPHKQKILRRKERKEKKKHTHTIQDRDRMIFPHPPPGPFKKNPKLKKKKLYIFITERSRFRIEKISNRAWSVGREILQIDGIRELQVGT